MSTEEEEDGDALTAAYLAGVEAGKKLSRHGEVQSMLEAVREAESDKVLTAEEAEAFRAFRPQSTVKPVALPKRSS